MRWIPCVLAAFATGIESSCLAQQSAVTRPEQHLGHALGQDFVLPDWNEVRTYFEKLDRESPRVKLEKVGASTEGRDYVLAIVSGEANIENLDKLRGYSRILADPRGATAAQRSEALEKGKVFLFVSCAMHATECAAPQFAMEFAHAFATSADEPWKSARENCVLLLLPSTNPDGLDHVVSWYRRTVGTPYEASELTKLYQYYAGHDNNRDWFALTQQETRIVSRLLYADWHPQVFWDVHQQGSKAERMFVPPFRDPLDPNLDAGIIGAINLLGTRAQLDMAVEGKTGVASGGTFDMWWNGGNRNVPVRHNIVGLLTEMASCRLASPMFLQRSELDAPDGVNGYVASNHFLKPWPGGWWRIRDILDYEGSFARSLVGSLSRERGFFLANALGASDRTLLSAHDDVPKAWILPSDNEDVAATRRLVDILLETGVELGVADNELSADGRAYPKGSIVIRRDQPYGIHVKDLFEIQHYPKGDPPYDVAGWTLPFLFGVRRVEVVNALDAKERRVTKAEDAVASFASTLRRKQGAAGGPSSDGDSWKAAFAELAKGGTVTLSRQAGSEGALKVGPRAEKERESDAYVTRLPRIGLYSPWTGNMDEGWMRWVFDTFGLPFTTVRNEMLRAGSLPAFLDVLVLPSLGADELDKGRAPGSAPEEFTSGLDPEGAIAVEEFVRAGGTLVTVGSSGRWAIDLMKLPLVDVTQGEGAKDFSCPGSVLRIVPEPKPAITAGLPESLAVFFSRSTAWREANEKERSALGLEKNDKPVEILARYAPTRLLLSGWIQKPELVQDQIAWACVKHGRGRIHLFGFRPQYRGWSQADFQLLFRSILFAPSGG